MDPSIGFGLELFGNTSALPDICLIQEKLIYRFYFVSKLFLAAVGAEGCVV